MEHPNLSQTKTERIENRCTKEQKELVQYAAAISGVTITDFSLNALMEKAEKVIRQHQILELTLRDQKAFANALIEPAEPNEALKAAKKRHQKEIKK